MTHYKKRKPVENVRRFRLKLYALTKNKGRGENLSLFLPVRIIRHDLQPRCFVQANDVSDKVRVLYDGYALRGDQVECLREHLDVRKNTYQL